MLSPEEKSPPRWLSFLEVGAGSNAGQAQVQSLIVVNVGAGAEGGESPGTSQNSVAAEPITGRSLVLYAHLTGDHQGKVPTSSFVPSAKAEVSHRRHSLLSGPDSVSPGKFSLSAHIRFSCFW